MLVRFCLQSYMLGLQHYVKQELPDVQAGFRKGRGTRDRTASIRWIIEKAREFQKNIYLCIIDDTKAFDCVDHDKLGKLSARREDLYGGVKMQQLGPCVEKPFGSRLRKAHRRAACCDPVCSAYTRSPS